MFDPVAGRFLPDRYVEGTCPICGYADARGDQCDNCGNTLDPTDLINPRSKLTQATPELRQTEHFFFDLPQFSERLLAWTRNARRLAPERAPVHGELGARGIEAARDHPRSRLGRADPRARIRGEAHLRLVRRRDRLPEREHRVGRERRAHPRRGGSGGRSTRKGTRRARRTTSSARTMSRSTRSSGRRS